MRAATPPVSWTPDLDEEMEAIIRKKMAEGVTFFVVTRKNGKPTKLEDAADAKWHRAKGLHIPDEDLRKFVETGATATVTRTPTAAIEDSRISRNPKEVVKSNSVGVKQRRGG